MKTSDAFHAHRDKCVQCSRVNVSESAGEGLCGKGADLRESFHFDFLVRKTTRVVVSLAAIVGGAYLIGVHASVPVVAGIFLLIRGLSMDTDPA